MASSPILLRLKAYEKFLGALVVISVYLTLFYRVAPLALGDPDRYFHLAMARDMAAGGLIKTLPQVEELGWAKGYPNGYFLFSVITAVGYWIGGEKGTLLVVPLLALTLLLLIYLFAARWVRPGIAVWLVVIGLLCPDFTMRIVVLRPHLMGMVFGILLAIAVFDRKPWRAGAYAALFALTYHAFYLPLLIVAATAGLEAIWRRRFAKESLAVLVGVAIGIVVNPTFPHHVESLIANFGAAFGLAVAPTEISAESLPLPLSFLVASFSFFFLCLLGGTWEQVRSKEKSVEGLGLVLSALGFWGLCLITGRAVEYAVPLSLLAIAWLVAKSRWPAHARNFVFLLPCLFVLPGSTLYLKQPVGLPPVAELNALDQIPRDAAGKKVFNCDWQTGSLILYGRPDLRFVDLLDAHFLELKNPEAYRARLSLKDGGTSFAYGAIRYLFASDYVLCRHRGLISQFESDPHFKRLYPKDSSEAGPFLYELVDRPLPNFLSRFEAAQLPPATDETYFSPPPAMSEWKEIGPIHPALGQPMVDLFGWRQRSAPSGPGDKASANVLCTAIRPSPGRLKNYVGATAIGVGGGPRIRLWWNGEPLYLANRSADLPRLVNDYVALPRPLREDDKLSAVVCSKGDSRYLGFSLSFWREPELRNICRLREARSGVPQDGLSWKYLGKGSDGCQAVAAHPRLFP